MLLIVDDNQDTCGAVVRLFRLAGQDARWVPSGPAALRFLEQHHPQAILLDVMMPGMSGIDVLRKLRAEPDWADIPVIMYSAGSMYEDEARALGARDFVVKGVHDWVTLYARVMMQIQPEGPQGNHDGGGPIMSW